MAFRFAISLTKKVLINPVTAGICQYFLLLLAAFLADLSLFRFNSIGPDIVWADLLLPDKFLTKAIIFQRFIPRTKTVEASRFSFFSFQIWSAPLQFLFKYLLWGELLEQ
ncbi:hypothetical protein [uncultured Bartonella sp.]|uniref:hypothetical protein n=1 Tax=uncultured Bartonella sp. TaxID=104108 RepID=UPI0025CD53F0|nr:hypothetical protein [uncultured Bartonella sp.]